MWHWQKKLEALAVQQGVRSLPAWVQGEGANTLEGSQQQTIVSLGGNDYLGLAKHPALKQAAIEATERYGTGMGASRVLAGQTALHLELEAALCQFLQAEAALVFASGFQANVSVLPALCGENSLILWDKRCHASLVDGIRLSGSQWQRYRHNDVNHLESLLQAEQQHSTPRPVVIVTDSLFSMEGDIAPLLELATLAERYNALLFVDEAHATGLYGQNNSGLVEAMGLAGHPLVVRMGTFSKALGGMGAFVAGERALINALVSLARGFVYSTGLPPAVVAADLQALRVVQQEPQHLQALWANVDWLRNTLQPCEAVALSSVKALYNSPILHLPASSTEEALSWQASLLEAGVYAPAIRPPTVPKACLRFSVNASFSEEQKTSLANALGSVFRSTTGNA